MPVPVIVRPRISQSYHETVGPDHDLGSIAWPGCCELGVGGVWEARGWVLSEGLTHMPLENRESASILLV